jgi:ABC-type glycerol-3-phosphate transport system substrate-binding protein
MVQLEVRQVLIPLNDLVYKPMGVDPNKEFIGDGMGVVEWKGDYYGVPTETGAISSVVNVPVDDVKKLGLADKYPPTNGKVFFESFESMWELAKALQIEKDGKVVRWGISAKGWEGPAILGLIRTLLAPQQTDWWDKDKQKFNVDSEAGIQAFQLLVEKPVKMGIETELDQNQVDAALAGKVALAYSNGTPALTGGKLGYHFELAGAPRLKPGEDPLFVGGAGWTFVAVQRAKNTDLAIEFLKMMITTEAQREWAKTYGGIPSPWRALTGKYDYYEDPSPDSPGVKMAKMMMESILPRTRYFGEAFGYQGDVEKAFSTTSSELRQLKITPQEAAKKAQALCEAQYKQFQDDVKNMQYVS